MDRPTLVLLAGLGLILTLYAFLFVVKWPTRALWVAIPLLLWPSLPELTKAGVLALLLAGIFASRAADAKRKPLILYVAFVAVMAVGWFVHGPGVTVERTAAQNSLIAALLNLGIVPAVAALRPPLASTLKVLGASGAAIALYLMFTVDVIGGRAWVVGEHNPNAMGVAAAVAVLCLVALARLGYFRWLLLVPVPLLLFVLTQTRSGLLILTVGVMLLATIRVRTQLRVAFTLLVLGAFPLWAAVIEATQRLIFTNRESFGVEARADALLLAARTGFENPVLGVGWRQFTDVTLIELGVVLNAHNDYALIAAEGGLLAALLFVGLSARTFTFEGGTREADVLRALLIAFLCVLAFGNLIADLRSVTPLYVLLGMAWGKNRRTHEPRMRKKPLASEDNGARLARQGPAPSNRWG